MATIIAELVGFLVIVFVLYRYVWPRVRPLIEDRQDQVSRQVTEADEAERELAEARRKHDSAVTEAEQDASRIRDDARADAARIREELQEQADQEVARIKQRGEEQLVAQRDAYARGLRVETGALSVQLAQRIVGEFLSDENEKRASVDGFLDGLDGIGSGDPAKQPAQTGGGVS